MRSSILCKEGGERSVVGRVLSRRTAGALPYRSDPHVVIATSIHYSSQAGLTPDWVTLERADPDTSRMNNLNTSDQISLNEPQLTDRGVLVSMS